MRDDEAVPGELGGRHEVDRLARHHIGCDAGQPWYIGGDRLLWLAEGGSSDLDPGYAARVLIPEGHHREFDDIVHVRIQPRGLDVEEHGPLHVWHRHEAAGWHRQPAKHPVVAARLELGGERLHRRIGHHVSSLIQRGWWSVSQVPGAVFPKGRCASALSEAWDE